MTMNEEDPRGLKARLRAIGKTQSDLAAYLGVDFNVVNRIASGARKRLSDEESNAIEAYFAAHAGRSAPMAAPAAGISTARQAGTGAQVPLYGFAAAAPTGPINFDHETAGEYVARHPNQGRNAEAFAVRIWGESMSPRYEPGELAYCVRGQHPRRGQDVIIELKSGDAWLKTYEGQQGGQVRTRQLNPPPGEDDFQSFDMRDIKALHAVVGRG